MAKHDWVKLKAKYLSGEYKDLKEFSENENISYQVVRNNSKGWNEEKLHYDNIKVTKITEKTIEKIADKEANRNARILDLSDRLANKVEKAIEQLEQYLVTNKVKTKTVEYGEGLKPIKEIIREEEIKHIIDGIIDKQGLKTLTSALKDIKDINTDKQMIEINSKNHNLNQDVSNLSDEELDRELERLRK